jgi:hypothetical protein
MVQQRIHPRLWVHHVLAGRSGFCYCRLRSSSIQPLRAYSGRMYRATRRYGSPRTLGQGLRSGRDWQSSDRSLLPRRLQEAHRRYIGSDRSHIGLRRGDYADKYPTIAARVGTVPARGGLSSSGILCALGSLPPPPQRLIQTAPDTEEQGLPSLVVRRVMSQHLRKRLLHFQFPHVVPSKQRRSVDY